MDKYKRTLRRLLIASTLIVLGACGGASANTTGPVIENTSYQLPTVQVVDGYEAMQSEGDVTITIAVAPFTARRRERVEVEQRPAFLVFNDQYTYDVRRIPYYVVGPDHVVFSITIVNQSDHVLPLSGIVVRQVVNGDEVPFASSSGIDELLSGFVLPGDQAEFQLVGPHRQVLPNDASMSLMLYSVVTELDAAGNPTARTNFDWYFTIDVDNVRDDELVEVEQRRMTPDQARLMQAR